MSGKPSFTIGYATSDQCRASCMASENPISSTDAGTWPYTCNDPIIKHNVLISRKNSEGEIMHYHLECFTALRQIYQFFDAGTDFLGYSELQPEDQDKVKIVLPEIEAVSLEKALENLTIVDQPQPPLPPPSPTDYIKIDNRNIQTSVTDFEKLSTQYFYIDKTLLIHEVLNDSKTMMITAPRRQGKSTMLSMLKYFFQIHTHKTETVISEDVKSGKSVIDNSKLFDGRNVKEKDETMKHLGKYPVVHLNFTGDPTTKEEALTRCQRAIHKCYLEHEYLKKSKVIDPAHHDLVAAWCHPDEYKKKSWSDVQSDVQTLSRILEKHWKKGVIILIDEYDAIPMNCLWSTSMDYNECVSIKKLMGDMFGDTVKHNDHTERVIMTGITFVDELWSFALNDVTKYRFLGDHKYNSLCGLTDEDVKEMLKIRDLSDKYEEVRSYYNGFTTLSGHSIYSMWSILNYLIVKKLKTYGSSTGSGSIFLLKDSFRSLIMREKMYNLLESKAIPMTLREELSLTDIKNMKEFLKGSHNDFAKVESPIFSLFLDQGCLAYADSTNTLKVPNGELMDYFHRSLTQHFEPIIDKYELERTELTGAFNEIFEFIFSREHLPSVLATFLEKMNKLLTLVCGDKEDICEETVRIVFCRAAEMACPALHVEQRIREPSVSAINKKKADYCSFYESGGTKIGVLVELKVNSTVEAAKKQIFDCKYIRAFEFVEKLKTCRQVFVMGLNVDKTTSPFKWKLIYTLHNRPRTLTNENEMLKEAQWETVRYSE